MNILQNVLGEKPVELVLSCNSCLDASGMSEHLLWQACTYPTMHCCNIDKNHPELKTGAT